MIGRWCRPRLRGLLTVWLVLGVIASAALFAALGLTLSSTGGINLLLAATCFFVLPRVLFLPLLNRKHTS